MAFVEARVTADAAARTQEHMSECAPCRRLVSEAAKYYLQGDGPRSVGLQRHEFSQERTVAEISQRRLRLTTLAKGTMVSRYEVVGTVGAGGMGVVYAARDPHLGRTVALKLMRSDGAAPADADKTQARLLREARAMACVAHPNVVVVHDAAVFDGQVFVAMELVQGKTLGKWLRETPRNWREVVHLFVQAGWGLAAAHRASIVHRDFKPENVLVGDDGRVRVTDFGLARPAAFAAEEGAPLPPVDGPAAAAAMTEGTLTRTGMFIGTPAYMAPEQFRGDAVDARADQFSFCVALYEAVYGARPFAADDLRSLSIEVTGGRICQPPHGTAIPDSLREVLLRGLRIEPAQRFPSMEALILALDNEASTMDAPPVQARRPRSRWLGAVVGGAGILMIGAAVLWQVDRLRAVAGESRESLTMSTFATYGFTPSAGMTPGILSSRWRRFCRGAQPGPRGQCCLSVAPPSERRAPRMDASMPWAATRRPRAWT